MPVSHLLDTSVYCQPIRKHPLPSVVKRWTHLGDDRLCVSVLCEAELLQGLEAQGSKELWGRHDRILRDRLQTMDFDKDMAQTYSIWAGNSIRRGRPRPVMDLLIAASAKAAGLVLATLNAKDFEGLDGLVVEDWSS